MQSSPDHTVHEQWCIEYRHSSGIVASAAMGRLAKDDGGGVSDEIGCMAGATSGGATSAAIAGAGKRCLDGTILTFVGIGPTADKDRWDVVAWIALDCGECTFGRVNVGRPWSARMVEEQMKAGRRVRMAGLDQATRRITDLEFNLLDEGH